MAATDKKRREVAARLRKNANSGAPLLLLVAMTAFDCPIEGQNVTTQEAALRLADLIDPTCEVHRDALFYPATDLTWEYEETVFRCGKCEEIVSYDADYDPETDLPAYCERCGSRITGIGEPWDE